ncbi:hypothetical protein J2125_003386 [Erwinia toletana]|uniref:Uncharacterized protein n=1 Tax=Winslowiella toletana TaxID=92490 RepID=A0ABS4PC32_9GAMM|nr:hypothetical protein [Winslowiella toletana]
MCPVVSVQFMAYFWRMLVNNGDKCKKYVNGSDLGR